MLPNIEVNMKYYGGVMMVEEIIPFQRNYIQGEYIQVREDGGWGRGADNYGDGMGGGPPPGFPLPPYSPIVQILDFDHMVQGVPGAVPSLYFLRVKRFPRGYAFPDVMVHSEIGHVPINQLDLDHLMNGGYRRRRKSRKYRKSRKGRKSRKN